MVIRIKGGKWVKSSTLRNFKDETAKFILESEKSACSVAAELNIDKNQVCKWVKQYREKNNLPRHEEEKKVRSAKSQKELDLERENKRQF